MAKNTDDSVDLSLKPVQTVKPRMTQDTLLLTAVVLHQTWVLRVPGNMHAGSLCVLCNSGL